jgi:hypothetical protein
VLRFDRFPFSTVDSTNAAVKGQCKTGTSPLTLIATVTTQETQSTFPPLSAASFPCTPATAGVDTASTPANVDDPYGEISFVDFLDGGGLATVKVSIANIPSGTNQGNAELYELAHFPADLTATDGPDAGSLGDPVPDCVFNDDLDQWELPAGTIFVSCVYDVDPRPGGGLVFWLRAKGGEDGGWGGAG